MDLITLLLFCTTLLVCIIFDISIVYALIAGFIIFVAYGLYKGFSLSELLKEALSGVKTVKNILNLCAYRLFDSSVACQRHYSVYCKLCIKTDYSKHLFADDIFAQLYGFFPHRYFFWYGCNNGCYMCNNGCNNGC